MCPPPDDGGPLFDPMQVLRERDLYRKLLELGAQEEIEPSLEEALALMVEVAGAERGYLELRDEGAGPGAPRFWITRGCSDSDVAAIRAGLSRGAIEAALCAPIGARAPLGALYLQGRARGGPFSDEDRRHAEIFARSIAHFAHRLVARQGPAAEGDMARSDATGTMMDPRLSFRQAVRRCKERILQEALARTNRNITATARRLELTRQQVYNLMREFGLEQPK